MFSKLVFFIALIALGNACSDREVERRLQGCGRMMGPSCREKRNAEICLLSLVEDCLDEEEKASLSSDLRIVRSIVRRTCGYKK